LFGAEAKKRAAEGGVDIELGSQASLASRRR
jgi:hypothetical protein